MSRPTTERREKSACQKWHNYYGGGRPELTEEMMHGMTPKRFAQAKEETTSPAHEVIAHLYKALQNMEPFTLMDGRQVRVEKYSPPEINDQGEAECGVDVKLPDGSHLEFMVKNTGWGKSFANEIEQKRAKRGRRR